MQFVTESKEYEIEKMESDSEIDFVVKDENGYVCRLVPVDDGFALSTHDKSLGVDPGDLLITRISNFILAYYG